MKEQVIHVQYVPLEIPDKPGEGAKITKELAKRGINLLAVHGFPTGGGKAQLDIVPEKMEAFTNTAKELGWKTGQSKTAFLIQGDDRVGAVAEIHDRLADANISIVAATAVAAGSGRYGCIVWVPPAEVQKTARTLDMMAGVR